MPSVLTSLVATTVSRDRSSLRVGLEAVEENTAAAG